MLDATGPFGGSPEEPQRTRTAADPPAASAPELAVVSRQSGPDSSEQRAAQPHRRDPLLDRPVRGAGRRHRPADRRVRAPDARRDRGRLGRGLPGAVRHPRACRSRTRTSSSTSTTVLFRLVFEAQTPSAIAGSMLGARAGARGIREVISSEMWECLNVTAHGLSGQKRAAERLGPHVYLRYIRERAALFFGLADSTMSHDDAWRFLVLGRVLERADMTARLLLARMSGPRRARLARCCCAPAAPTSRSSEPTAGRPSPHRVAEFLLLDRLFPRSVVHALSRGRGVPGGAEPGRGQGRRRRPGPAAGRPAAQPARVRRPQAAHRPAARAAVHPAGDLRRGERGDRPAVLPVRGAGRLGTGWLSRGLAAADRAHHQRHVRRPGQRPRSTRRG